MVSRQVLVAAAVLALAPGAAIVRADAEPLSGPASVRLDNPFVRGFENQFCEEIAFAGDVDGDGDHELLVAAQFWGGSEGRVALYAGSASGPQQPPVKLDPPSDVFRLGTFLAPAGDIDADGYDDVVIGAGNERLVYYGSPTGLGAPVAIVPPEQEWSDFSLGGTGPGDVNGDGFDDVVVGDRAWDGEFRNQGRLLLYLGSESGLQATPTAVSGPPRARTGFGSMVAPAGDVNGDSYADLMVGAPDWRPVGARREGRGYVFLGSSEGLQRPAWVVDPANFQRFQPASNRLGQALGPAGDVNGDGYDDIVFGLPNTRKRIYLYFGSAEGPTKPAQTRRIAGEAAYGFGAEVVGAGDLNGDGFDEVVVGAPEANVDVVSEGRTFTFLGTRHGLSRQPLPRDPSNQRWAEFGDAIAGMGDVDGDGTADLAICAPEMRLEPYRGRAYVYH